MKNFKANEQLKDLSLTINDDELSLMEMQVLIGGNSLELTDAGVHNSGHGCDCSGDTHNSGHGCGC